MNVHTGKGWWGLIGWWWLLVDKQLLQLPFPIILFCMCMCAVCMSFEINGYFTQQGRTNGFCLSQLVSQECNFPKDNPNNHPSTGRC